MSETMRKIALFALVAGLIVMTGMFQSWNTALLILNMGLISAIMSLGVNLQWGFAGLFNVGVMGFVALGGLATVLIAMPPVGPAWEAGGLGILAAMALGAATVAAAIATFRAAPHRWRGWATFAVIVLGFVIYRSVFDPARNAVEAVDPAAT